MKSSVSLKQKNEGKEKGKMKPQRTLRGNNFVLVFHAGAITYAL